MKNDWIHIPGFNGYVINSDGIVKSYKNYKKYPNGYFIKNNKGNYNLSNNQNEIVRIHYRDLLKLCKKANKTTSATGGTYMGSRNLIRPAKDGKLRISEFFRPAEISDKEL